jgi:hypothetical protein
MNRPLRLAVFMPEFKWARMNLNEIKPDVHGIELVAVELDVDLAPFDGILHKFTYQLVDGHAGDVDRIASYIKSRPGFIVIEPIDHIRAFIDRLILQDFFSRHPLPPCVEYCEGVLLRPDTVLSDFPILVKSANACGTSDSHFISVIHDSHQLSALEIGDRRLIAFPFVPHFGVVYKVYALGQTVTSRATASLSIHGDAATSFDSQKPLPPELLNESFDSETAKQFAPSGAELAEISRALQESSGVQLIGFDLLRRESDRKLVLVDFNYFPCFRGIEDIPGKVAAFIKQKAGRS